MAQITVEGLDDEIVARLGSRAERNGQTLHDEVKAILQEAASIYSHDEAFAVATGWQQRLAGRVSDGSADLIRDDRER